jgi:SAM-dependent methyltransferase
MTYIDYLGITREHKVLDFGCAKGYVVKALRLLYRQAWGCDISSYALEEADKNTRRFLNICSPKDVVPFVFGFDFIIVKDVLEHISEFEIDRVLAQLLKSGKKLFAIIPLGENDRFVIPANNLDKTHVLAKNPGWWIARFEQNGWDLCDFQHRIPGIKDHWSHFEKGDGFFLLERPQL